jgi:NAD(P)-dependent dehydrogenase (short-subunit alcohol dehydrogenase family)
MSAWTRCNVPSAKDLSGKRVLVTGLSAGLGVKTARALAEVLAQAANGSGLELVGAESLIASLESVRACADVMLDDGRPFDAVIAAFGHTAESFETQFATKHLGHFVLVNRIASLTAPSGWLVNVSSSVSTHFIVVSTPRALIGDSSRNVQLRRSSRLCRSACAEPPHPQKWGPSAYRE